MPTKVFIMGGTIDNLEYDAEGKAPLHQKSIIPHLLKKSRISLEYAVEDVCFKDSRLVNDHDRELLLKRCKECPEERIVVTHGTMTMAITAKYVGKNKLAKTII